MDLKIKMSADATAAERGVAAFAKRSEKLVGSIGAELSNRIAGAFAVGAVMDSLVDFGRTIVNTVDEVKDLSEQLGISTEEVQRLQAAADKAGVKFGKVNSALESIEAMRSRAMSGEAGPKGIFDALGIDPSQGSSLEVLQRAVDASARGAREQGALVELVGKRAQVLKNVMAEMQALGPISIIDDESIAAIDSAAATLKEIKRDFIASAASSPEIGFWGRAVKRGAAIDKASPGAFNFALTRGILGEMFGGTEGGVDLSALPLPDRSGRGGAAMSPLAASLPSAAIPLGQPGDALSRIGLFVGSRPEVGALRSIDRNTADTARQVSEANRILREILAAQPGI